MLISNLMSVLPETFQNGMSLSKDIFDSSCIFGSAGRAEPFKFTSGDGTSTDDV